MRRLPARSGEVQQTRLEHRVRFAADDPHLTTWAESLGAELVVADLAARDGSPRHDPLRLASAYAEIMGI